MPPAPSPQPLILASNSPRRRELLAEGGYQFNVMPPHEDVECGVCSESGPAGLVAELAYRKAAAVVGQLQSKEEIRGRGRPGSPAPVVLAADTVAECDGMILGKPSDEAHARAMLLQLSGREHRVLTGICLWPIELSRPCGPNWHEGSPLVQVAVTRLRMDPLTESQLNEYLTSGQWEGKAGAFGYQDRLGWVHIVEGSESNVVGLPMELLAQMLTELEPSA
jgi:septum formation protein